MRGDAGSDREQLWRVEVDSKRCILEGGSAGLPDRLDLGTEGKVVVQDDSGRSGLNR